MPLGAEAIRIFTRNQMQLKWRPLSDEECTELRARPRGTR